MKKKLLLLFALFLIFKSHAQISFEIGYFINNSNKKIECLIKNIDWKNNLTEFKYKLLDNDSELKATIKTVKAFEVYNQSKYERHIVNIDRSSNEIKDLTTFKNPKFIEEQLFLKVLVQGKANLYLYEAGNLTKFFYKVDSSNVNQLLFKRYLSKENKVANNNSFKQQLWNTLKCEKISSNTIKKLNYKKNDLVKHFVKYNECFSLEIINFEKIQKRDLFNLTIRPGINISSLSIENVNEGAKNTSFDNEIGFRFGLEFEFIMPFNKNKWSIIFEPTYQYFNSKKEITGLPSWSLIEDAEANYKSIELPFGVRHYLFLNEDSKLFINGSIIFDLSSDSTIDFGNHNELEIKTRNSYSIGLGYKYKNRHSLELKFLANKDLFTNYKYWKSKYNTVSVIYGYSIF